MISSHIYWFLSDLVGLIECKWFHTRFSCFFSLLSLLLWSYFLDRKWAISCHIQLAHLTVNTFEMLVLLTWQEVSDCMPDPAGLCLTVIIPTIFLLAWQVVSDSMLGPTHYYHSCFCFSIGLTVCEWFYVRSIMFLLSIIIFPCSIGFPESEWLNVSCDLIGFLFLFSPHRMCVILFQQQYDFIDYLCVPFTFTSK